MEVIKKPVKQPPKQEPKHSPSSKPPVTKGSYRITGGSSVECANGHTHSSIVAAIACGKN